MHILTGDDVHQHLWINKDAQFFRVRLQTERFRCCNSMPHAGVASRCATGRWRLVMRWASPIMWVYKSLLFSCCRRPRRGFPNWAKWSHGTRWAAEKQRRAAAQTATMKMGVKHRETVRAKTVSRTQTVHTQLHSVFSLTLSASSGQIDFFVSVHGAKCRCLWPQRHPFHWWNSPHDFCIPGMWSAAFPWGLSKGSSTEGSWDQETTHADCAHPRARIVPKHFNRGLISVNALKIIGGSFSSCLCITAKSS